MKWINSSYEFKCNLSENIFLGIFAVWLVLTYSWTTMAHIPWPPFIISVFRLGIGTGSIVPVYGDETSGYEENIICISDYWIICNCKEIFWS